MPRRWGVGRLRRRRGARAGPRRRPWIDEHELAAIATDTWGIEVLPNETKDVFQPLHIVLIVHIGMLVGEIFDLEALADRLRRRRALRVPVLGAAAADHGRGRVAGEPAGHQVGRQSHHPGADPTSAPTATATDPGSDPGPHARSDA